MRSFWIILAILAATTTLLLPASRPAHAEEAVNPAQIALLLDGHLKNALSANSTIERVTHNLCGIGLGGYCPGRYRSCIRAGRPQAECDAWVARCDACNEAMLHCRQRVGHLPGFTCTKCRRALDRCRAELSITPK
jgi:hypothetical protein